MVKSAGNISSEPILLPFQISIVPNFVSTKENREPVVTAVVFGSQDQVRLSVSGHTAIHTIVIQPDLSTRFFKLRCHYLESLLERTIYKSRQQRAFKQSPRNSPLLLIQARVEKEDEDE